MRVAGLDPGTSSLDIVILSDGQLSEERRFTLNELSQDPGSVIQYLEFAGPFQCIAGPSGYGVPLVSRERLSARQLAEMVLVRMDDRGRGQGILGFQRLLHVFQQSSLPVVYLPGVIHLGTVPADRKINRIDMGTPDKLCVAALALAELRRSDSVAGQGQSFVLLELGTAFTAAIVVQAGKIVDGYGGSAGALGWSAGGAIDSELAYLLGSLSKSDIFSGGAAEGLDGDDLNRLERFVRSNSMMVQGICHYYGIEHVVLSGRMLEIDRELESELRKRLTGRTVSRLHGLSGGVMKHAAQGAAILADGLSHGTYEWIIGQLELDRATGGVTEWLLPHWRDRVERNLGLGN